MTEREIGMGKLMKYVEEMQKEGINICRPTFQEYYLLEMMLISKYYGLIKWLVENDKIDLEKLDEKAERKPQYTFIDDDGRLGFKLFEVYESLLMLLSISDTPIEDLLLYLK